MPRAGLTKERIVEAALKLIAEAGPEALTARALASRLGVQAASLYNHVESLDAVRAELGQAALSRLDSMIAEETRSGSTRDRLLRTAAAYRRFALEEPALYQLMMWVPGSDNHSLIERGRRITARLCEIPGVQSLGEAERRHFVRAFHSAVHGFVSLEQAGFFAQDISFEESFFRMLEPILALLDGT